MGELSDRIAKEKSADREMVIGVVDQRGDGALPQAMLCPNCGMELQERKCKLLCPRPGCGYQVTCSEW